MVLSCHKPIRIRLNTHYSKCLHWIKSSLNEPTEISNLVINLQLDSAICIYLTKVINHEPVPGLVIRSFYFVHLLRLNSHILSLFPGYVHLGIKYQVLHFHVLPICSIKLNHNHIIVLCSCRLVLQELEIYLKSP